MLVKDPLERITLENIKQHPFLVAGRGRVYRDVESAERIHARRDPSRGHLDQALLDQMATLGVDVSDLRDCLAARTETEAAPTYRILLRAKMAEEGVEIVPYLLGRVPMNRSAIKRESAPPDRPDG
jgi:hypothetical protein